MSKYIDDLVSRQRYMERNLQERDPFEEGIQRAIKSSKQSTSMNDRQSNAALRNSILSFGSAIGSQPKVKGLFANLAQVGNALAPAMQTYDNYENSAIQANENAINRAYADKDKQEARAANLEQMAYQREINDRNYDLQREMNGYKKMMGDRQYELQKDELANRKRALEEKIMKEKAMQEIAMRQAAIPTKPAYAKELVKDNIKFLNKRREQAITDKALVETLNDLEQVIEEANAKGQVGSNLGAIARRKFANYISGDNKAATLADVAKYAYFSRIKEAGGANPSEREMLEALKTVPSIEKNPAAALEQLDKDRANATRRLRNYENVKNQLIQSEFESLPDAFNGFDFSNQQDNEQPMIDVQGSDEINAYNYEQPPVTYVSPTDGEFAFDPSDVEALEDVENRGFIKQ